MLPSTVIPGPTIAPGITESSSGDSLHDVSKLVFELYRSDHHLRVIPYQLVAFTSNLTTIEGHARYLNLAHRDECIERIGEIHAKVSTLAPQLAEYNHRLFFLDGLIPGIEQIMDVLWDFVNAAESSLISPFAMLTPLLDQYLQSHHPKIKDLASMAPRLGEDLQGIYAELNGLKHGTIEEKCRVAHEIDTTYILRSRWTWERPRYLLTEEEQEELGRNKKQLKDAENRAMQMDQRMRESAKAVSVTTTELEQLDKVFNALAQNMLDWRDDMYFEPASLKREIAKMWMSLESFESPERILDSFRREASGESIVRCGWHCLTD